MTAGRSYEFLDWVVREVRETVKRQMDVVEKRVSQLRRGQATH